MKKEVFNSFKVIKNSLTILIVSLGGFTSYSQNYTKEIIKLWDHNNIPFNKENIVLTEIVDSTGRRISQISDPVLYVYRKKEVKSKGAGMLYCPGGGYAIVSLKEDGEAKAKRYLQMGFNVVAVLKYRLPDPRIVNNQEKVPLCDAQKALALLHQNANKWLIDEKKIAITGSSAGGHLAASLANLKEEIVAPEVEHEDLTQALSILLYPVVSFNLPYRHEGSYNRLLGDKAKDQSLLDYYSMESQVTKNTPPTFIIHAKDDFSVTYENSTIYADSLKKYNVPYKYIELEKGGHGFEFNLKKTGVDWTKQLEYWLHNETDLFKSSNNNNNNIKKKIILKLDDLAVKNGVCKSMPVFKLLEKKQIKASFGIIPARCDSTLIETLNLYLKSVNKTGDKLFEIWHHGYDHIIPEFKEKDYSYQKEHFEKADKMIKEILGIQMHSFGAPGNATDSITNSVILENEEYKVFMFSKVIPRDTKGILYLENRTNMEDGTGNLNYNFFTENYIKNKERYSDYMVLQGHPKKWSPEKIKQFERIIDFLILEGCEFVLPYEYYLSKK